MADNAGKTVREILKGKRAVIFKVRIDPGSPSGDDIMDLMWEDVERRQRRREKGFRTFHKLLSDGRFDK